MCRRFQLVRDHFDGVNDPGVVAEGVVFGSGKVALSWTTKPYSIATFDSMADLIAVQNRNGITRVAWLDMEQSGANRVIRGDAMAGLVAAKEKLDARLGRGAATVQEDGHALVVTLGRK
jgi:hypothetical protein